MVTKLKSQVKKLAVLGSTGSIGRQTLDIVRAMPGRFRVVGLAAGSNLALLYEQAQEFKPEFIGYAAFDSGHKSLRERRGSTLF